jgi:LysR family hydrogen peroxide-inducible transcriptional activator
MNLQQMEYIIAVEQHRHFGKAAAACFVTQPTLSMMIQKLEDELGIKVFDKEQAAGGAHACGRNCNWSGTGYSAGGTYHERSAATTEAEPDRRAAGRCDSDAGALSDSAFCKHFSGKIPEVHLSISERITGQVVRDLKNNDLDVGILVGPLNDPSIRESPLFYEPLLVYSSHGFDKTYLLPEDIDRRELLLLEEGHCLRSQSYEFVRTQASLGESPEL